METGSRANNLDPRINRERAPHRAGFLHVATDGPVVRPVGYTRSGIQSPST